MGPQDVFVCDTHPLAWFLTRNPQLSEAARTVLRRAQGGEVVIYVPTIVLAEFLFLTNKGKLPLERLLELLMWIELRRGFRDVALDLGTFYRMLEASHVYSLDLELHDLSILASALTLGATLITKDRKLRQQTLVETIW